MHSWLVRDTPPKAQLPVSCLAANNNVTSMPSFDPAAEEAPELETRLPKRFASEYLAGSYDPPKQQMRHTAIDIKHTS